MNGIGDFITSAKEVKRLAAQVIAELKGDVPGHEFHGNQYSDGGGSSGGSDSGEFISFGDTPAQGAQGQALGDRIVIDKQAYSKMNDTSRLALVAHEYTHNKIEDSILKNNDEWNKASDALVVAERNGRYLFVSGETRIGEAISNVVASKVAGTNKPEAYSNEQWDRAMNWADYAIKKYGGSNFIENVHRQKQELDSQL